MLKSNGDRAGFEPLNQKNKTRQILDELLVC